MTVLDRSNKPLFDHPEGVSCDGFGVDSILKMLKTPQNADFPDEPIFSCADLARKR